MGNSSESKVSLHPLELFYERDGRPLPPAEALNPEDVPPPYQALLIYDHDMTPTLESFYQDRIHLQRLHTLHEDRLYAREVVLELDGDKRPVVYGVNRIHLESFPEDCRERIVEGLIPLGTIMGDHVPGHYSQPSGFFRLRGNTTMEQAFRQAPLSVLYGRTNEIFRADGIMLSEVVEILAPIID